MDLFKLSMLCLEESFVLEDSNIKLFEKESPQKIARNLHELSFRDFFINSI